MKRFNEVKLLNKTVGRSLGGQDIFGYPIGMETLYCVGLYFVGQVVFLWARFAATELAQDDSLFVVLICNEFSLFFRLLAANFAGAFYFFRVFLFIYFFLGLNYFGMVLEGLQFKFFWLFRFAFKMVLIWVKSVRDFELSSFHLLFFLISKGI